MPLPTYTNWTAVPPNLATKTQLSKDGLKLAPDQQPLARKNGMRGKTYLLYDRNTAVPKRPSSPAQLEAARRNIEKAQAALCCLDCHTYGERLTDGRCRHCHRVWRARQKSEAWFADILNRDDWLIVDTETTGLGSSAEIVQIGVVSYDGRVLMNQLVRPMSGISYKATAVHGITLEMLADEPDWTAVYPEVARLVEGKLLLAYNAEFDGRMLRQTCGRYDLPTPPNEWGCVMERFAQWQGEWSNYWRDFRWVTLGHATEIRGVAMADLHDAGGDALTTWRLMQSFKQVEVIHEREVTDPH